MSHSITISLLAGIGETDCEAIADGFLAQPVNALSSFAYIVAGLWLVVRASLSRGAETSTQIVFGLALAGVGVGSVAFHGPMPPGAQLVHDLTIATVFAVILTRGIGSLWPRPEPSFLKSFAVITAIAGAVMALSPGAGLALLGLIGVAAVAIEITVFRTGTRGPLPAGRAHRLAAIVALVAVAGLFQLLGRTGGPLCHPDSILQGHAAWHVLTATAFGLYGTVAFPVYK